MAALLSYAWVMGESVVMTATLGSFCERRHLSTHFAFLGSVKPNLKAQIFKPMKSHDYVYFGLHQQHLRVCAKMK